MVDINAQLENRELGQMQAMANRWRGVENALELQIRRTIEAIQMRQEAGQPVGRSAISNLESYRELLKQISGQARDYEKYASGVIGNEQLAYGKIGITTAQDMLKIGGMVDFNRLNVRAVQNMVGITADGSPLFDVLKKRALAPEMVSGLTDYLVEAIAMGYNPRKTAEMMANGLAAGLTKALTIARTEQIRAYRQASVDQYRQTGVIEQFQRHAVPAERTCLACLALDGEIQDSKEAIASHPNCRCFVTPIIPGFSAPEFGSGEDWLRTQNEAVQRKVLGARFEAWQGGTPLRDMVKITLDKTWGPTIGVRSLGELFYL